jgi:hypothetical protein
MQDLQVIRDNFPIDSCLLPPDLTVSAEAARAFDALIDAACAQGPAAEIVYTLPYPKYLFLEHLAATRGLMLHGSNTRGIDVLRPIRYSSDSSAFGNQDAIYATQDPLWGLFFAVLDKSGMQGTTNGAIHLVDEAGARIRRYYFALDEGTLRKNPWIPGAMYLLPGADFEPDPSMLDARAGPYTIQVTHWIHRGEVQPLARLDVEPEDFPYLHRMWGYGVDAYRRKMEGESLAGFPYLDDPGVYPIMPR